MSKQKHAWQLQSPPPSTFWSIRSNKGRKDTHQWSWGGPSRGGWNVLLLGLLHSPQEASVWERSGFTVPMWRQQIGPDWCWSGSGCCKIQVSIWGWSGMSPHLNPLYFAFQLVLSHFDLNSYCLMVMTRPLYNLYKCISNYHFKLFQLLFVK